MNNSTQYFKANFPTATSPAITQLPTALAIFVVSFMAITILAATVGNACVCISLLRRRRNLREMAAPYLLGSLALTGLLSALLDMPLMIIMTVVNYFPIRDLPVAVEVLCKTKLSTAFALTVLNALTLSLMAFDRHDCVLRPFTRRITKRNVKKIICVTWVVALIIVAIFAILTRNEQSACIAFYPYNDMSGLSAHLQATIATFGQFDTVIIVVIIVTFVRITRRLRSSPVESSNSAHQRIEKNLTELTFKICGIFLLFRIPAMICHLLTNITRSQGTSAINTATLMAVTLVYFVYVLNPFVHFKMLNVQRHRTPNTGVELAVRARENQHVRFEQ